MEHTKARTSTDARVRQVQLDGSRYFMYLLFFTAAERVEKQPSRLRKCDGTTSPPLPSTQL